ncbi:membrane protein [Streptomyces sp. NRRL B-1568]|nr:membrane protein [Streptomyces sp. NRRL B-1568]
MGMGWCIGLIAAGAILTFAVDWHIDGMNVHLAGLILMAVGILGLSAYVSVLRRRRVQPPPPAAPVVEEDHRFVP